MSEMSKYPGPKLTAEETRAFLACLKFPFTDHFDGAIAKTLTMRGLLMQKYHTLPNGNGVFVGYSLTPIGGRYLEWVNDGCVGEYRFRSLDAAWVEL